MQAKQPQHLASLVANGPFDFPWLVGFLAARAAPALETVSLEGIRRAVRLDGRPLLLTIRPEAHASDLAPSGSRPSHVSAGRHPAVSFTVTSDPPTDPGQLEALTRRMLDLAGDVIAFHGLAATDPILAPLVAARPGIRLPQIPDPFEALVRAILGQQVSVAAARTMTDRLIRLLGDPVADGFQAFPSAETVAATSPESLARLGLTGAKSRALQAVAEAVARGDVDWRGLAAAPFEEAVARLCALPGVGPWTAAYVRLRGLADHDAFPATDLGVIRSLRRLHPAGEALTIAEIREIAEGWRPWRGYATVQLWSA